MAFYTSPERVERDGFLVAFKGEKMTETEARRRGLLGKGASSPAPDAGNDDAKGNEAKPLTGAQLRAELENRGIPFKSNTKVADLQKLLDDALAQEAAANDAGSDANAANDAGNDGNDGDAGEGANDAGNDDNDGDAGEGANDAGNDGNDGEAA